MLFLLIVGDNSTSGVLAPYVVLDVHQDQRTAPSWAFWPPGQVPTLPWTHGFKGQTTDSCPDSLLSLLWKRPG